MRAVQGMCMTARLQAVPARRIVASRRVVTTAALDDSSAGAVGSKVEKWLKTPFDIAAFGARLSAGALVSFPEKLQSLPQDVEKVTLLVQDPRPLEEKGTVLLQEVEDTMVQFLERGTTIETDVLSNVKSILPPELADTISQIIPKPPNQQDSSSSSSYGAYDDGYGSNNGSYSSSYDSSVAVVVEAEPVTFSAESIAASQVAAEVVELKRSVLNLKSALEAISTSTDSSQAAMLRINLQDARDQLARSLQEAGAGLAASPDPSVAAAAREAQLFLNEVDAQFFPSKAQQ